MKHVKTFEGWWEDTKTLDKPGGIRKKMKKNKFVI